MVKMICQKILILIKSPSFLHASFNCLALWERIERTLLLSIEAFTWEQPHLQFAMFIFPSSQEKEKRGKEKGVRGLTFPSLSLLPLFLFSPTAFQTGNELGLSFSFFLSSGKFEKQGQTRARRKNLSLLEQRWEGNMGGKRVHLQSGIKCILGERGEKRKAYL